MFLTSTDGSDFMGERLIVQFARGSRRNENFTPHERVPPRPRRTPYRMRITNLPVETSWQVRHPILDFSSVHLGPSIPGSGTPTALFMRVFYAPKTGLDSA